MPPSPPSGQVCREPPVAASPASRDQLASPRAAWRPGPPSASVALFGLDLAAMAAVWPPTALLANLSWAAACVFPVAHLVGLYAMGLYRREALAETRLSLARLPLVVAASALGGAVLLALAGAPGQMGGSGQLGAAAGAVLPGLAFIALGTAAFAARSVLFVLLQRGLLRRRVMVVGAGGRAWELLFLLQREGRHVQHDLIFLHAECLGARDERLAGADVLHDDDLDVLAAARACRADLVVVAPDERRGMDMRPLLACKRAGIPVMEYLRFLEKEIRRLDLKRMELGWLVFSDGFRFGLVDRVLKRLFDIVAACVVLIPAAPLLLGAVIAIRLDGPGPIFYRQERVTRDNRRFAILKLRTMRVDAERGGAVWAAAGDARVTRVGRFLRRTRIDELPQLLCILRGDMSFVGPRPERPVFVEQLARDIPLYPERHMVKAGLTGWAQINYPYGASVDDARSKLSYDLYYVKNFSVLFDALILMQTLRVVLWPGGVR